MIAFGPCVKGFAKLMNLNFKSEMKIRHESSGFCLKSKAPTIISGFLLFHLAGSCYIRIIHTYIIHTYIHIYIHTYIHTYIHIYIYTYIHIYIHTLYIHTYIHTYIMHIHTHTYACYILHCACANAALLTY